MFHWWYYVSCSNWHVILAPFCNVAPPQCIFGGTWAASPACLVEEPWQLDINGCWYLVSVAKSDVTVYKKSAAGSLRMCSSLWYVCSSHACHLPLLSFLSCLEHLIDVHVIKPVSHAVRWPHTLTSAPNKRPCPAGDSQAQVSCNHLLNVVTLLSQMAAVHSQDIVQLVLGGVQGPSIAAHHVAGGAAERPPPSHQREGFGQATHGSPPAQPHHAAQTDAADHARTASVAVDPQQPGTGRGLAAVEELSKGAGSDGAAANGRVASGEAQPDGGDEADLAACGLQGEDELHLLLPEGARAALATCMPLVSDLTQGDGLAGKT
jgi:hypothetical protein